MWSPLQCGIRPETIPYRVVARTVLVLYDLQSVICKVQYRTEPRAREELRVLYEYRTVTNRTNTGGGGGYNVLARTTRLSQSLGIFRSMF